MSMEDSSNSKTFGDAKSRQNLNKANPPDDARRRLASNQNTMKRPKEITTLETIAPFTDDEISVLKKAINTFSTGGHPMPEKSNIGGFGKVWVAGLLKKSEKMLDAVAKNPEVDKDLRIVRQLIQRFNRKSKI